MSDRKEFHGCVGQNVFGNVNEAPHNNIYQLNFGTQDGRALTSLQRKMIHSKVSELASVGALDPLDVYRILLSDFGSESIESFPRQKYVEVMFLLDYWINEQRSSRLHKEKRDRPSPVRDDCAHGKSMLNAVRNVLPKIGGLCVTGPITMAAVCIFTIGCATLLRSVSAGAESAPACALDGKTFSVGSLVKMPNGEIRECSDLGDRPIPRWNAT